MQRSEIEDCRSLDPRRLQSVIEFTMKLLFFGEAMQVTLDLQILLVQQCPLQLPSMLRV